MGVDIKDRKATWRGQEKLVEKKKKGHWPWAHEEAAETELGPKETGFSHPEEGVPPRQQERGSRKTLPTFPGS